MGDPSWDSIGVNSPKYPGAVAIIENQVFQAP